MDTRHPPAHADPAPPPAEEESFARTLRALRERALLTQEELARRSGLSVGTVRGVETGRIRRPRLGSVRLLIDALDLPESDRQALVSLARGSPAPPAERTGRRPQQAPEFGSGQSPGHGHGREPASDLVPAQLPAAVVGFTGRTEALKLLSQSLPTDTPAQGMISVIAGTAGVGKTALAVHWAQQVRDRFPDGQLYVNLRGFTSGGSPMEPAEAIRGFLDALWVPPHRIPATTEAQSALYRTLLADRSVLVVLDNARDAAQVRPLLPGSPRCLTLVTGRDRLSSLVALEGAHLVTLDLLPDDEARELLTRRLGVDRMAAEPRAVDDIVTRCVRLPLALAIVAARAAGQPEYSLATLADQLDRSRDRLDALAVDDPALDVRAVFSWSYHALSPDAARLFRLLGLHPAADVTVSAAASLAGTASTRARRLLDELTRAHLIAEHIPGRYAFHDLLRAYAAELADHAERDAERHEAVHRMLDHYLHTAHGAALLLLPTREPLPLDPPVAGVVPERLTDHRQAAGWFVAEHAVMLAAVEHAASTGFDAHAGWLAWTLQDFLDRRGHWSDLTVTQHRALSSATRRSDLRGQADAHRGLARAYFSRGDHRDAHTHLRHALSRYAELGDVPGQADTARNLSLVLWHLGHGEEALRHAERALALYTEAGHEAGRARAFNAVGWCLARLGDYPRALAYCQEGLVLQQRGGDRFGQAHAWHGVAHAHHRLGQHEQAVAGYRRAVDLFRDLHDRYDEAICLAGIGDVHAGTGDLAAARQDWALALDIFTELDHPDAEQVRAKLG
ncbi:hypothetical protein GCM10022225_30350 [Plantactinospora mayteni]|uniref:HTH cro/C1-type domain-containing protein n=1 Tax=Plantactinospora mayteni TaxID=566021 RepID=A0ABQ4EVK3_9ACTN|nr:tetratricopeptide repeat protein [Plantactinospora mayteni]GIG98671.1 hypothetical protein Pma05_52440 [Plantactinospora mayteni]